MAAWDDDLRWASERYDRLEALIDEVADGWYEDWNGLSVDDPTNERSEQGDDRPLTERRRAA